MYSLFALQGQLIDAYQYRIDLTKHDHRTYRPRSKLQMLSLHAVRAYKELAPYALPVVAAAMIVLVRSKASKLVSK